MNIKRLLPLLTLPIAATLMTGCTDPRALPVDHAQVNPSTTIPAYVPPSTTTTAVTPDLTGYICWTETNPASPDGVESLCDTSDKNVRTDLFLHWGKVNADDSPHCWTSSGVCNIRINADDIQTTSGNWVPKSFVNQNIKDSKLSDAKARQVYLLDQVITEDSKYWRCSIDGNKVCGE